jgi:hypothetical protein
VVGKIYRFANLLSLDVVLGAMVNALFFSFLMKKEINPVTLLALSTTVWIIYTVDHLLDASTVNATPANERYAFHHANQNVLWFCVASAVLVASLCLFALPFFVIINGGILSICIVVYFLLQKRFYMLKESMIAVLYTLGVMAPSLDFRSPDIDFTLPGMFALTAFLNLVLFSLFGEEKDMKDGQRSLITWIGHSAGRAMVIFVYLAISLTFALSLSTPALIVFLIATGHMLMFFRQSFFIQHDRYRLVGDALFVAPAIYLLLTVI